MRETDLPSLEPEVRAVIDDASGIGPAPASARLRIRDGVEAVIAGGGAGGGGSGTDPAPRRAVAASSGLHGPGSPAHAFWGRAAAPLVLSFALGAVTSTVALMALGVPQVLSRAGTSAPAPVAAAIEAPPVAEGPVPAVSETSPAPSVAASERPSASVAPRTETPSPRTELALERRLLDKARTALEAGEPAAALSAVARHERRFPSGVLTQEREAMAIRALVALGRTAEARARAARFRARYPGSVLLSTIDEMFEGATTR